MKKFIIIVLVLSTALSFSSCNREKGIEDIKDWRVYLEKYEEVLSGISEITEKYPEAQDIADLPEELQEKATKLFEDLEICEKQVDVFAEKLKNKEDELEEFTIAYFSMLKKYEHLKY